MWSWFYRNWVRNLNFKIKMATTYITPLRPITFAVFPPGGFSGAGCVGLASANIEIIYESGRKIKKKSVMIPVK
jgi:hypothetical protein